MVNNVIIMAGGAGKRLWPASLGKRPKQFMKVGDSASLFRNTLERAFKLGIDGSVYVITHKDHATTALEDCMGIEKELKSRIVIMAEPVARNTAPALALAAVGMNLAGKLSETSLVMAADHIISPIEAFISSVEIASIEAEKGFIVPYGVVPDHPSTGYGYIEAGKSVGGGFEVNSFHEKPDRRLAENYLESGKHFWNAGLFTYRNNVFLDELNQWSPEIARVFASPVEEWFNHRIDSDITVLEPTESLVNRYLQCQSISVDYAVMEKTDKIRMVKAEFEWNDVGSWDTVSVIGSPSQASVYSYQSKGNFVYSDLPVALCGVDNLIVAVANGRVMICRKGQSQLVKEAAEEDLTNS